MYKSLIAISNRKYLEDERAFLKQVEKIAKLGPKALLLREKDLNQNDYEKLAIQVYDICSSYELPLIIHTHYKLAQKLNIPYIHLPLSYLAELKQDPEVASILSTFEKIGTSLHSLDDLNLAKSLGATYAFAGNVFETTCKPGLEGRGLDFLDSIVAESPFPIYAIGGINKDNLNTVLKHGAAGACMMSGFMKI
jgi:thiamine-phosphate pyrophosphorylase